MGPKKSAVPGWPRSELGPWCGALTRPYRLISGQLAGYPPHSSVVAVCAVSRVLGRKVQAGGCAPGWGGDHLCPSVLQEAPRSR